MSDAANARPTVTGGAAGLGLATFAGDLMLDVWYPDPALGTHPHDVPSLDSGIDADPARGVRVKSVVTIIDDLQAPPASTADAYLRLHLLSHRLVQPRTINLDGIFAVLPIVAWTDAGAIPVEGVTAARLHLRRKGQHLSIHGVRLGAHLASGTVVMHEGFVNFNAGTLGTSMVEGRISAGVVVGDGSDVGGGASIMGTLSGGGTEVVTIGRGCLIGANAGVGLSLGDNCIVEAGLYVTAGSKVTLPDGAIVKARELSGASGLLFRRNSVSGAVEVVPTTGTWTGLNAALHTPD